MQSQRGSVTVIAIAMLLFLMLIAVAWLPMMTMEKTAASSDYREQQAWYAAEAGYKRAVAQLEAGNTIWKDWLIDDNNLKDGAFSVINGLMGEPQSGNEKLAGVLENGIWYAVAISSATSRVELKHGERGDGNYTPVQGETYSITSIGSCNGIRKVIRKEYTLGDNGGTGGEGGEETLKLPGLVQAGGSVTIAQAQDGPLGGGLYGSGFIDNSAGGGNYSNGHTNKPINLKTHIPDAVFQKNNYADLNVMSRKDQWNWVFNLESGKNYFWDLKSDSAWYAGDYTGGECTINAINSSGAVVFIDNKETKTKRMTGKIIGPKSGLPVTFVFTGDIELAAHISDNVRIFAAGDFKILNNQGAVGFIMLMSNGEMNLTGTINKAFLSSDKNMTLTNSGGFYGQAQVRGDFKTDGAIHYNDEVLKKPGFTVPKGMS